MKNLMSLKVENVKKIKPKKHIRKKTKINLGMLIIIPGLAGLAVFYIIPMIMMIYYSFTNESGFVGINNYVSVYQNNIFRMALFNTILFTTVGVILITVLSIATAQLVRRVTFFKDIIQSMLFAPLIVPTVSVIMVSNILFEYKGIFNSIFSSLGLNVVDFYNTKWSLLLIIIFYLWKNIGYNVIILSAALENVSADVYEAADIDGASSWNKFKDVTVPSIKPTIIFVVVISTLNTFKAFREIFLLLGAYPNKAVYSLQHYMNNLFSVLDYQKLSVAAITVLIAVVIFVLLLLRTDRE